MARVTTSMRGPGMMPLLDRLLDPHVAAARALGAEVADRGEPCQERVTGVHDGAGGAEREWLLQHLLVPERFVVRVQEQVRVRVDEPRQHRHVRQVDRQRIRWAGRWRRSARPPRSRSLAPGRPTPVELGAVEHRRWPQHHDRPAVRCRLVRLSSLVSCACRLGASRRCGRDADSEDCQQAPGACRGEESGATHDRGALGRS